MVILVQNKKRRSTGREAPGAAHEHRVVARHPHASEAHELLRKTHTVFGGGENRPGFSPPFLLPVLPPGPLLTSPRSAIGFSHSEPAALKSARRTDQDAVFRGETSRVAPRVGVVRQPQRAHGAVVAARRAHAVAEPQLAHAARAAVVREAPAKRGITRDYTPFLLIITRDDPSITRDCPPPPF